MYQLIATFINMKPFPSTHTYSKNDDILSFKSYIDLFAQACTRSNISLEATINVKLQQRLGLPIAISMLDINRGEIVSASKPPEVCLVVLEILSTSCTC